MKEDKQREKTTLSTLELRRQIAKKVDVLGNIISIAKGEIPEAWKNAEIDPEDLQSLRLSEVVQANYKLLDRLMPTLKSVEVSEDAEQRHVDYDANRQKLLRLLSNKLQGVMVDEDES